MYYDPVKTISSFVSQAAILAAVVALNQACFLVFYQPEMPECLKGNDDTCN